MNETLPTAPESDPTPIETTAATPVAAEPAVAVEPAAEAAPEAAAPVESQASQASPAVEMSPAATAAKLKELFPGLFAGQGFKPLKLRVQADIQERAPGTFTKAQLSAFLRRYTGSTGYLIALTKAKTRFDLDGQPAGDLTEEHLAAAREELVRRKGLQQERVNAEQEQAKAQQAEAKLLQQQRYNRAGLLHDYERTTLTLANFCVLKGTTPEELPGLLEIAKAERAEAPPVQAQQQRPQAPHREREPRRDDRRPRNAGPGGDRGGERKPGGPNAGDRRGPPRGPRPAGTPRR